LPVGAALAAVGWMGLSPGANVSNVPVRTVPIRIAAGLTASILVGVAIYRIVVPAARSEDQLADAVGWRNACEWIRVNTPSDAVVLVPPNSQSLHWRAERAEVVTEKDLPHDAAGLIAWSRRIFHVRAAYAWTDSLTRSVAPAWDGRLLTAVAQHYGATWIVYYGDQLPLPVAYPQKGTYTVYQVPFEKGPGIEELLTPGSPLPHLPAPPP
jgi:hypothetical protein